MATGLAVTSVALEVGGPRVRQAMNESRQMAVSDGWWIFTAKW